MSIKNQQIQVLYQFILENGFNVTLDEIASGIHVTKKTLHNRYKTKAQLEQQVIEYWRSLLMERFEDKFEFTNNSIEQLLILIYELEALFIHEFDFFRKECQHYLTYSNIEETFFQDLVTQLIEKGKYHEEFVNNLDTTNYVKFFLFNIFHLFIENSFCKFDPYEKKQITRDPHLVNSSQFVDYIDYLLSPLLTEKGKTHLSEIDLISFFKIEMPESS